MKYGIVCLTTILGAAASCGGDAPPGPPGPTEDSGRASDSASGGSSGEGGSTTDAGTTGGSTADASTGGTDDASTGGADDGGPPGGDGDLGSECETDADCQSGFCLDANSTALSGGGPAGGLCAIECFDEGQAICDAEAPGSACVRVDDAFAICLESCVPGPISPGPFECHGRTNVACFPDEPGAPLGTCQPTCESDSECGDRVCDIGLGVCVDEADRPDGLPVGSECDPDDDDCSGFCRTFADDVNLCTGVCNRSVVACLSEEGSPADAACLFTLDAAAAQDIGLCGQLCDDTDDCLHPELRCADFPEPTQELTGRQGFCTSQPEPVSDAGAGDAGPAEAGSAEGGGTDSAAAAEAAAPVDAASD